MKKLELDEKDVGIVCKILRKNELVGLPGQKQIYSTRSMSFFKLWYNLEIKSDTVYLLCFTELIQSTIQNESNHLKLSKLRYKMCYEKKHKYR